MSCAITTSISLSIGIPSFGRPVYHNPLDISDLERVVEMEDRPPLSTGRDGQQVPPASHLPADLERLQTEADLQHEAEERELCDTVMFHSIPDPVIPSQVKAELEDDDLTRGRASIQAVGSSNPDPKRTRLESSGRASCGVPAIGEESEVDPASSSIVKAEPSGGSSSVTGPMGGPSTDERRDGIAGGLAYLVDGKHVAPEEAIGYARFAESVIAAEEEGSTTKVKPEENVEPPKWYIHVWGVEESGRHHGCDLELDYIALVADVVSEFCRVFALPDGVAYLEIPRADAATQHEMESQALDPQIPLANLQCHFGDGSEMEFQAFPVYQEFAEGGGSGDGGNAGQRFATGRAKGPAPGGN